MHFLTLGELIDNADCPRCSRDRIDNSGQCDYCDWPQNDDGTWPSLAKEAIL